MHQGAYEAVFHSLRAWPQDWRFVLEVGSRNINGSVRPLLLGAGRYVGVDLVAGPGVDVVADAETYTPDAAPDLVLCCEVFEHAPRWPAIVARVAGYLAPGGFLCVTAAAPDRAPHSALDGRPLGPDEYDGNVRGAQRPGREYYANVDPGRLLAVLRGVGLAVISVQHDHAAGDVYALARQPWERRR